MNLHDRLSQLILVLICVQAKHLNDQDKSDREGDRESHAVLAAYLMNLLPCESAILWQIRLDVLCTQFISPCGIYTILK